MMIFKVAAVSFTVGVLSILNANTQQQSQVFQAQPGTMPQIQTPPQNNAQTQQLNAQNHQGLSDGNVDMTKLSGDSQQKQEPQEKNEFLEYYSRQGSDFSASVYYQEGTRLVKRNLSSDDLKKAVIVFFGDWCPHCEKFLTEFSKNIEFLRLYGIKIIFLNVPSIDRLKNWKEPNVDEFNIAENKISSYGIKLSKKIGVALLGDRVTLAKAGVEGLPVIVAIKNGKEYFRGIGESGVSKLNFSNQSVLKRFLEIWDEELKDVNKEMTSRKERKEELYESNSTKKQKRKSKKNKKTLEDNKHFYKIDIEEAKKATNLLNEATNSHSCVFYK